jgi:hypothetical protein
VEEPPHAKKQSLHKCDGMPRHYDDACSKKSVVWYGSTGDYTLVVSKHAGLSIQRYAHHSKRVSEAHDLFGGNTNSDKLQTVSCHFNDLFMLGELFDYSLIDKMDDASTNLASIEVMVHEIYILKSTGIKGFASRS